MSRIGSAFLFSLILLFAVSNAGAAIVSHPCDDDHDGVIRMGSTSWIDNSGGDYQLNIVCSQWGSQTQWDAPGHIAGDFVTDITGDPKVLIMESVTNDTSFAWTDYHIIIGMPQQFSFVPGYFSGPTGWLITPYAPTYPGTIPNEGGTGWVGSIDLVNQTGSPIAIGSDLDFGFKIQFNGTVNYCTQQTPTPEPTTIALLGLGAISILRRRVK